MNPAIRIVRENPSVAQKPQGLVGAARSGHGMDGGEINGGNGGGLAADSAGAGLLAGLNWFVRESIHFVRFYTLQ